MSLSLCATVVLIYPNFFPMLSVLIFNNIPNNTIFGFPKQYISEALFNLINYWQTGFDYLFLLFYYYVCLVILMTSYLLLVTMFLFVSDYFFLFIILIWLCGISLLIYNLFFIFFYWRGNM